MDVCGLRGWPCVWLSPAVCSGGFALSVLQPPRPALSCPQAAFSHLVSSSELPGTLSVPLRCAALGWGMRLPASVSVFPLWSGSVATPILAVLCGEDRTRHTTDFHHLSVKLVSSKKCPLKGIHARRPRNIALKKG